MGGGEEEEICISRGRCFEAGNQSDELLPRGAELQGVDYVKGERGTMTM